MVRRLVATLSELGSIRFLAGRGARGAARFGQAGALVEAPDPWQSAYTRGGVEPPLEDVLSDPIIQLVMRSDRPGRNNLQSAPSAGRR